MKKKIIMLGLALGLGLGTYTTSNIAPTSFAASAEEMANNVDPTELEYTVQTARYLLDNFPNTVKGHVRVKLEKQLEAAEALLEEVYEFKRQYAPTDNLNIRVKNQIRANLDARNEKFTVNVNSYTNNQQITDWFLETAKEDWYFFYSMYDRANVATKYNPKKAKDGRVYVDSVTFTISYRGDAEAERMVEEFADQWIADNIKDYDSDYRKALKIHDFIATANQYNRGDSEAMSGGYSIYHPASILFGNGGVCNAYATLFDKLGSKAGLDVRYATGSSKKTGEPHIWNMVKINENWYNIDVTWDDPTINFNEGHVENLNEFVIYDYFLKSDKEMRPSREIDKDINRPLGVMRLNHGLKNASIEMVNGEYRVVR